MTDLGEMTLKLVEKYNNLYTSKLAAATNLQYLTTNTNAGLTMARANAIKNLASALQERSMVVLESLTPYNKSFTHSSGQIIKLEVESLSPGEISELVNTLPYYGLTAWLNQAIASKNNLLDLLKSASYNQLLNDEDSSQYLEVFSMEDFDDKEFHYEMCDLNKNEPKKDDIPVFAYIFTSLFGVSKFAEYLSADAEVKRIGPLLHKGGALYKLHNASYVVKSSTESFSIEGQRYPVQNTLMYSKDQIKAIQDLYIRVQAKHLKLQEFVNYFKKAVEDESSRLTAIAELEYKVLWVEWSEKKKLLQDKWDMARREYDLKRASKDADHNRHQRELIQTLEAYRNELRKEIADLRIFTPAPLRELQRIVGDKLQYSDDVISK